MSEVQVEEKVTVQTDVCLSDGEGNVTVYSDVWLRYRLRETLLCTITFV